MGFLSGKRALIVGLATDRSIAWGIAQAMHREGADLACAHRAHGRPGRSPGQAARLGYHLRHGCGGDEDIASGLRFSKTRWPAFDILVHAVAFATREALTGEFLSATTRDNFRVAYEISSYSLTALARASQPFMQGRAGSIVALSYLGAVRSIPGYNVMGLAKASLEANVCSAADLVLRGSQNAISCGPIKTLSAAGIPGLRKMLSHVAATAPIRRNVTIDDVGNSAAFLCSTGRRHHRRSIICGRGFWPPWA